MKDNVWIRSIIQQENPRKLLIFNEASILQKRKFDNVESWVCVCVKSLSRVRLFATPWTVAYHAPPSMGFSRQEYWSGLPFPSPEDLPHPGIESRSQSLVASLKKLAQFTLERLSCGIKHPLGKDAQGLFRESFLKRIHA